MNFRYPLNCTYIIQCDCNPGHEYTVKDNSKMRHLDNFLVRGTRVQIRLVHVKRQDRADSNHGG